MLPKLVMAYGSRCPFTKVIGTAQPLAYISMFWKELLCGSSWTASSQSHRGNTTSFGGSTTPQPRLMSRKRGDLQSASPGDRGEDSGQGSPNVRPHLPVFIPTGENILADAVSRFQEIPDWQLHPSVTGQNSVGASEHRSIAPRHYRAAATQDKREKKKQNKIEREN
jgi:hypothetical protein